MDSALATRLAFGTSLAVMIPTMISGTLAHHDREAVNWRAAVTMGCAAILGGPHGGTLPHTSRAFSSGPSFPC